MTPTIHLALTHDWELRGDGSGDIEQIQFAPLRRLLSIYQKSGARTTFMPDVMQQLTFRRFEEKYPELKLLADAWEEHVLDACGRGHDIQLHLHSQWSDAKFDAGRWRLAGSWSLLDYPRERAAPMLSATKSHLESVVRRGYPNYRCIAFRASALALAPSKYLLPVLAETGIEIDVSMAGGFFLNNQTLDLDYRGCEESFLPYYPQMDDARRVSTQSEPIVCVPLNHFYGSRREVTRQNVALATRRLRSPVAGQTQDGPVKPQLDSEAKGLARVYEKLIQPAIHRKYFVSDLSRLNYRLMCEMLASIRERARASGQSNVPVVLTNHPKDIRDWDAIERFVGDVSEAKDIEFATLSEIAAKVKSTEIQVRKSEPSA